MALVAGPAASAGRQDGPLSFLENGTLRVGVDLTDGGKITYLSRIRGEQAHDLLQDAQQSYYGGTPDAPWHVAASGGTVLLNRNDGRTIYTKVIPRRDAFTSTQCSCTFETWVSLKGNTVHVRNRLTNTGGGALTFTPHGQELPAVYTTGDAYRLFTYDGDSPFTGAPIREVTDDRGGFFVPGPSFLATEHWAALVNEEGFGIGLFEPRLTRFAGIPGNEYAVGYGWVNGYLAASTTEMLESTPAYTYDYTLVVGDLEQIRGYAVAHRPDPRPNYLFRTDRQHWWELNASDPAGSVRGALRLYPDHYDPQVYGPETSFPASGVRALYIRGAWHTQQDSPQLFWASSSGFDGDHVTTFHVEPDGRFHTYRVPLAGVGGWTGTIRGLRLDFVDDRAEPGHWVDISCISWRRCPHEPREERRLMRSPPSTVFLDSFDSSLNPSFWSRESGSPGTFAESSQGHLVLTVGPDAEAAQDSGLINAGIDSVCRLAGNYDVKVDYKLLEWPAANGVDVLLADSGGTVGRRNAKGEAYFAAAASTGVDSSTADLAGSLRLVRNGNSEQAYFQRDRSWIFLSQSNVTRGETQVRLAVRAAGTAFSRAEVQVAFDNFRVSRGRLSCP
jgi:hypothetical protein